MSLLCPKCRKPTLRQPVASFSQPSEAALMCRLCGGMWTPLGEAARLSLPSIEKASDEEKPIASEADLHAGLCPHGHGLLSRARIEIEPAFYLDRCPTCDGVFFDRGEWQRLAELHLLDDLAAFWSSVRQRQARLARSRAAYHAWAEDRFGVEMSERLVRLAGELRDHPLRSEALAFLREEMLLEQHPR